MKKEYGFDTLQLHGGQSPDPTTKSRAVPIYMTSAYNFDSVDHAANLFALKESGNIYTRIMNPTTEVLENRINALEGGVGALAVASGTSAIMYAIMNIAGAGDEVIAAKSLYGGTYNMFANIFDKYGMKVHFIDTDKPEAINELVNEKTKAVFIEVVGNPNGDIADIQTYAEIAHSHGLPLIVDNTFGTPYLIRPFEFGADIVVHSATKYLCGHGTAMGGLIVDSGNFDWAASKRFPWLTEPDPSYHGVVYSRDCGKAAFIVKARVTLLRDTGACISPFNSFLILQGIETLSLRMQKHAENAMVVAKYLSENPCISWVNFAGLPDNKYYELGKKYFPRGHCSIFSFGIKGGKEAGKGFIDSLELLSHVANVSDAKSLIIHPASTTHSTMSEEQQIAAGISPDLVRISVGLETPEDIIADLDQALEKSQK